MSDAKEITVVPDDRDNRENLPSASGMDRLAHCPGSRSAEVGLPELPQETVTSSGLAIHDAMETGEDEALDMTEKEIATKLREIEEREIGNWRAHFNILTEPHVVRETRMWIYHRSTGNKMASARPDVCYSAQAGGSSEQGAHVGFVCNYKSGFKNPTPSELSWQSRTEVIAFWHEFPHLKIIRGAFAQGRLSNYDSTDYHLEDLQRVERQLRQVVWASEQAHAPRVPGRHCRYCRAQGQCREYAVYTMIVAAHVPMPLAEKPDKLALVHAVERMSPAEMAFVFARKSQVETVYDAIKARLLSLPPAQLNAVGYEQAPGVNLREIVDVATAFNRLGKLLTDQERATCIKLVLGRAEEILAEKSSISKKKAKEQILEVLKGTYVEKTGNPRLKAI